MTPAERHNDLAREFATKVIGDVVRAGGSYSEVLVVLESTILAAMLTNAKLFKLSDRASVELIESAVHAATERFLETRAKP